VLDQIAMPIDVKDRKFFFILFLFLVLVSQDSFHSQIGMFSCEHSLSRSELLDFWNLLPIMLSFSSLL
jgi:hypothetical protein